MSRPKAWLRPWCWLTEKISWPLIDRGVAVPAWLLGHNWMELPASESGDSFWYCKRCGKQERWN